MCNVPRGAFTKISRLCFKGSGLRMPSTVKPRGMERLPILALVEGRQTRREEG